MDYPQVKNELLAVPELIDKRKTSPIISSKIGTKKYQKTKKKKQFDSKVTLIRKNYSHNRGPFFLFSFNKIDYFKSLKLTKSYYYCDPKFKFYGYIIIIFYKNYYFLILTTFNYNFFKTNTFEMRFMF